MSDEDSDLVFEIPSIPDIENKSDGDFQCPGCDRSNFQSWRGVKKHCTQAHPELEIDWNSITGEDTTPPGSTTKVRGKTGLEPKLVQLFMSMGMVVSFKCEMCGTHIGSQAPQLAKAWDNLAKENPKVRKALTKMLATSAWGEVAMVTGMTLIPIMSHHNLSIMPKPKLRVVPNPNSQATGDDFFASVDPTQN